MPLLPESPVWQQKKTAGTLRRPSIAALFSPGLRYQLAHPPSADITSEEFVRELQALADGRFSKDAKVEPFPNGENFYPAELEAIRSAKESINLEAYIFQRGEVTRQLIDALAASRCSPALPRHNR